MIFLQAKSSSIPLICSKLVTAKEPSVLVAYGSSAKPQFETLTYSSYESETCLIRENTSSLSIKQHSQLTGPVDKADRSIQETSSLGPSNMALARPTMAQNGAKGEPASVQNSTDVAQQVCCYSFNQLINQFIKQTINHAERLSVSQF